MQVKVRGVGVVTGYSLKSIFSLSKVVVGYPEVR
jgi:hypothetical protein